MKQIGDKLNNQDRKLTETQRNIDGTISKGLIQKKFFQENTFKQYF